MPRAKKTKFADSTGMDVLRVDYYYGGWYPDELIEGFSSVIWTERFQDPGEFEFKTPFIKEVRNMLPLDSFVTLRDSKEVMVVENHKMGRDSEGAPELTLSGRSLDAQLENRTITIFFDYYGKSVKMNQNYTLNEMIEVIVWNSFANDSGINVLHNAPMLSQGGFFAAEPDEPRFYDLCITDTTPSPVPGSRRRRWIREEQAHGRVMGLLVRGNLGIRQIRPPSAGRVVSVWTGENNEANRGLYNLLDWNSNITDLRVDVYNGRDRRADQTDNTPVIFTFSAGDLQDPEYLLSHKDIKTVAQVISPAGSRYVTTSDWWHGIDHKEILVDGGTPADNYNWNDFSEDLEEMGEVALKKANRSREILSTGISSTTEYEYAVDYNLGDKVTVIGEHDFRRTMVVEEYTRTLDAEGERGFPGLVLPWEI